MELHDPTVAEVIGYAQTTLDMYATRGSHPDFVLDDVTLHYIMRNFEFGHLDDIQTRLCVARTCKTMYIRYVRNASAQLRWCLLTTRFALCHMPAYNKPLGLAKLMLHALITISIVCNWRTRATLSQNTEELLYIDPNAVPTLPIAWHVTFNNCLEYCKQHVRKLSAISTAAETSLKISNSRARTWQLGVYVAVYIIAHCINVNSKFTNELMTMLVTEFANPVYTQCGLPPLEKSQPDAEQHLAVLMDALLQTDPALPPGSDATIQANLHKHARTYLSEHPETKTRLIIKTILYFYAKSIISTSNYFSRYCLSMKHVTSDSVNAATWCDFPGCKVFLTHSFRNDASISDRLEQLLSDR